MERERPGKPDLPIPLEVHFAGIPERLQAYNRWVVWRYRVIDDEIKKPPFDPKTGRRASVTRPETWGSFTQAQRAYATNRYAGVGIVLTSEMGIVGIDIDHCIADGEPNEEAKRIITALNSYAESSPSGTGIRILLEGKLPGAFRRRGTIELYEDLRYLTLTGHTLADAPNDIKPRHRELYGLYHRIFQLDSREQVQENTGGGSGKGPRFAYQLARSDEEVLQKALAAKNGANFRRYYHGDPTLWEGSQARHRSRSEADFTLVLMLLYWTNGDTTQADRLFRQSGLMRAKWTRRSKGRQTYGERIIKDALQKGNR